MAAFGPHGMAAFGAPTANAADPTRFRVSLRYFGVAMGSNQRVRIMSISGPSLGPGARIISISGALGHEGGRENAPFAVWACPGCYLRCPLVGSGLRPTCIIGPSLFHQAARHLVWRLTRQRMRFAAIPDGMAGSGAGGRPQQGIR